jgi:outer membrane protein TolC
MPLISFKIPIYRGKYAAQIREANLENESWKSMRLEQENALQTQLEFSWVNYEDAGRRILLYQQQIKIAKQTQNILLESYGANGKDFEEILRIQRMLLNYELQLVKAVKDNNTAVAVIETLY